jgi:transcriptional regulator with XRE-family HTH domain
MDGQDVRNARRAARLSQEELAVLLGISQTRLSRIESGKEVAPDDFRARLRAAIHRHEDQRRQLLAAL